MVYPHLRLIPSLEVVETESDELISPSPPFLSNVLPPPQEKNDRKSPPTPTLSLFPFVCFLMVPSHVVRSRTSPSSTSSTSITNETTPLLQPPSASNETNGMAPSIEQTAASDQGVANGQQQQQHEGQKRKSGLKEWWISSGLAALELENTGSVGQSGHLLLSG